MCVYIYTDFVPKQLTPLEVKHGYTLSRELATHFFKAFVHVNVPPRIP